MLICLRAEWMTVDLDCTAISVERAESRRQDDATARLHQEAQPEQRWKRQQKVPNRLNLQC